MLTNETKKEAILFIIQYIDKELKTITINNYNRIEYLKWRKKVNQDKLKNMKRKEIKEILINIISENIGTPEHEINEDSNFKNDLYFDSLDSVDFLMKVENEFNIYIPNHDAENFEIVKNSIDLVFEMIN